METGMCMIKEEMMLRFLSLSLACFASFIFFSWLSLLPSICVYNIMHFFLRPVNMRYAVMIFIHVTME